MIDGTCITKYRSVKRRINKWKYYKHRTPKSYAKINNLDNTVWRINPNRRFGEKKYVNMVDWMSQVSTRYGRPCNPIRRKFFFDHLSASSKSSNFHNQFYQKINIHVLVFVINY